MAFAFPDACLFSAWAFAFSNACLSSVCMYLLAYHWLLMGLPLAAQTLKQSSGTSTVCLLMTTDAPYSTLWCMLVCFLSLSMLFAACPAWCPSVCYSQHALHCTQTKPVAMRHRCHWCLPPSDTGAVGVQEAGMFLRMASGLGYCQVGDYVASLFFLFRRRGHRYAFALVHSFTSLFRHDPYQAMVHVKQVAAARCLTA
jgi:hypothetical protein